MNEKMAKKMKAAAQKRKWYAKHREHHKETMRAYYHEHREEILAKAKAERDAVKEAGK